MVPVGVTPPFDEEMFALPALFQIDRELIIRLNMLNTNWKKLVGEGPEEEVDAAFMATIQALVERHINSLLQEES